MKYQTKAGIILTGSSLFYTSGEGLFLDIFAEVKFRRRVLPILKAAYQKQYLLFLVLNAPEVFDGFYDITALHNFFEAVQDFLLDEGIRFVQIYYETNIISKRALPNATMLREILYDFQLNKYELLVVGHDKIDHIAAESALMTSVTDTDFFNTIPPVRT